MAGTRTLTATYGGDPNFNGSTSPGEPHTVIGITTVTAITADDPDPSVVGEPVTVNYKVTGNVPGGGAPSGNVTVTDGSRSCTGTVDAGQCAITFTTAGAKSLTATYAGDDLYNASPVSAVVSHQVNRANTTTHDQRGRSRPVERRPGGDRAVQRRGQRAGRRHADGQRDRQRRHRLVHRHGRGRPMHDHAHDGRLAAPDRHLRGRRELQRRRIGGRGAHRQPDRDRERDHLRRPGSVGGRSGGDGASTASRPAAAAARRAAT